MWGSRKFLNLANISSNFVTHKTQISRNFYKSSTFLCKNNQEVDSELSNNQAADNKLLEKDRTRLIPVETSIKYLKSAAYKKTYGDQLVWEPYRRNHKGPLPPKKTRRTCIRKGEVATGNPCPICRDEYLVLDHRNTELLKQFISPQTGQVLDSSRTGLCQKKHLELEVAIERAKNYGFITFDVPFRNYDYAEYYNTIEKAKSNI